MSVRHPAVAGTFYPADPEALRRKVTACLADAWPQKQRALAVLVPHAGYDYSGPVAGAVYSSVEVPRDVVLLAFNHRMIGGPVGLWTEGEWRTPLGAVPIATELVDRIREAFPRAEPDERSFLREHSAEVQLPFLQVLRPDVRIAPVSLNTPDRGMLRDFGQALARAAGDALVVATTDLTHCGEGYGVVPPAGLTPREWAKRQDTQALHDITSLNADGLWKLVADSNLTMCGVAPTTAMIEYALARGAPEAGLRKYATSADNEPDADRAVGYPGVIVRAPKSLEPEPGGR